MTKDELNNWIKSARLVDYDRDDYDNNGNHDVTKIFEKDGKLYAIDWQNDYPAGLMEEYYCDSMKRNSYRYVKDQFAPPREVVKKVEMVEQISYEEIENQTI